MPHNRQKYMRSIERRKLIVYCVLVTALVLLAALVAVMFITRQSPQSNTTTSQISVRGTLVCLPHKDTSGPQTLECAFGLRTNDNRYYMLQDLNSSQMSTDINTVVQVHGTLSPPDPATPYDIVGVITVDSLQN